MPRLQGMPALSASFGIGADAGGHYHQVGGNHVAVVELHGTDPAAAVVHQFLGLGVQAEADAAGFQRALQEFAGGAVQLAFQQPVGEVHDGHVHAALLEAVGRLQAEQAAADHHRVAVGPGAVDHGLGVGDVAVADHALQAIAGYRQDEGDRAGGQQQAVVLGLAAVRGDHPAADPVDLHHLAVEEELDAVFRIPVEVVEDDFLEGLLAGQHRGQQDAVVVGMGLGAEHRDVVEVRVELEQFFQGTDPGHAVADHHQLDLLHAE